MPIIIPNDLPARGELGAENIFTMPVARAVHQDIRPLRIAIINLMPLKLATETQLLRLLSNSPLQTEVILVHPDSHRSKNVSPEHLRRFYATFSQIRDQKFDGLIITGAPVETLSFEQVTYWPELIEVMSWSRTNVFSTLHICWGAQAGLYYHYGIPKYGLPRKMFGIFLHFLSRPHTNLLRGYDEVFLAPHSRHTEVRRADIVNVPTLEILAESVVAGVYIVSSVDGR